MKALEPPDSLYVQAARSCLESGNHVAARKELDGVAAEVRSHPEVLDARWAVEAQAREWPVCLEVAQTIVTIIPERPGGWIKRSYVLHRLKRTQEALDNLFPVVDKFSSIAIIPYNLACYAAQLQCLWEAQRWLKQAWEVGGGEYRSMALRDKDLQPLWRWIEEA
jgi:hypothetical protein